MRSAMMVARVDGVVVYACLIHVILPPRQPYPFVMMYGCHPLFICKRNAFVRLVGLAVRRRMAQQACGSRALAWAGRPCAARAGDVVPAPAGHLYLIAYMPGNIMFVHARSRTQLHAERTVGKRATDPRNRPVLKRIRQIERTSGSPSLFID